MEQLNYGYLNSCVNPLYFTLYRWSSWTMGTWSTWDRHSLSCHTSIAVWIQSCMPSCLETSDRRSSQPSAPVSREETIPGTTSIRDKQHALMPRQDKPGAAVPSQVPRQMFHRIQWHLIHSPTDYTHPNPSHLTLHCLLLHLIQWTSNFKMNCFHRFDALVPQGESQCGKMSLVSSWIYECT